MSKLSADNLYHYTNEYSTLINIINVGFEYRRCKEVLPLTGFSGSPFSIPGVIKHLIFPEVICFCDIPFEFVQDHVNQYGEYCIGLTKQWGKQNGITPIRYVHHTTPELRDDKFYTLQSCADDLPNFNNSMLLLIDNLLSKIDNDYHPLTQKDIDDLPDKWKKLFSQMNCDFLDLISFFRNYLGNMKNYEGEWIDRVTNKKSIRRFYDEREWRALKHNPHMSNLTFKWDDITEILIKQDVEYGNILNVLSKKFQISKNAISTKLKFTKNILKEQ